MNTRISCAAVAVLAATIMPLDVVAATTNPDFTRGDSIPAGATHDWNLGPTGARGWMYGDRMVTTDARQVLITKVDDASPAASVLEVGDVILGVAGERLSSDPRTRFGRAVTAAETEAGGGNLSLIRFYVGKGAVPYGDHHPWIQTHEDNGKCGMAAVLFNQLGEADSAEFFSRMSVAAHGPERDTGHTGNYFNLLWSLPGVALSGRQATGAWMREFGGWYFDLARRWDGAFVHQGPPQPKGDSYRGWDGSGAYLLAFALPLKQIDLTGKRPAVVRPVDAATAQSLIEDGRGWTNKDRTSFYDRLDSPELMRRLSSWSPVVRERAAMALARRHEAPVGALIQLLEAPRLESRYGACQALAMQKSAAAAPGLRRALRHSDLWLRVKEGIDACAQYTRTQNPWASEKRTPQLMEILLQYGGHAKSVIDRLEQCADYFEHHERAFPRRLSLEKAKLVRETIRRIEASSEYPELISVEGLR